MLTHKNTKSSIEWQIGKFRQSDLGCKCNVEPLIVAAKQDTVAESHWKSSGLDKPGFVENEKNGQLMDLKHGANSR